MAVMNNTSNFTSDLNCSPFGTDQYVAMAVLSACMGAVSAVASLTVIIGILASKKYLFFIQRLILYLGVAVLLDALTVVLRLQQLGKLSGQNVDHYHALCVFTGFASQTTSWSVLISICCITCCLLQNVLLLRSVEKLETVYVFLIFVFPLLFNWVPFIKDSYGEAGVWCWIRNKDDNCKSFLFGNYLRFIFWYIPLYVLLFLLIITYVVIIFWIQRLRKRWDGKFDPESKMKREKMRKEFRPLIWYPLIYLILNIFPLMNRIHDAFSSHPSLALWVLHAFSPLRGGFIALAYALDSQTLRRLGSMAFCVILRPGTRREVKQYPSTRGHSDSYVEEGKTQLNKNRSSNNHDGNAPLDCQSTPQNITLSVIGSSSVSNANETKDKGSRAGIEQLTTPV